MTRVTSHGTIVRFHFREILEWNDMGARSMAKGYTRSDWVSLGVRERKEVEKEASATKGLDAAMQIIPMDHPV